MDKNNSPKVSILKKRIMKEKLISHRIQLSYFEKKRIMKEKPIPHKNNILIKKRIMKKIISS